MGKGLAREVAVLALVMCVTFGSMGLSQSPPKMAPVSPAFERYLQAAHEGRSMTGVGPGGHALGYIPSPVDLSHMAGTRVSDRDRFPSSYDLRTLGGVTPIRDQGACGSCWAFATMGALESELITEGKGTRDLSENNLKECHGFTYAPCKGGNAFMSMAYLGRRSGPLTEASDPYFPSATGCSCYGRDRWPGIPVSMYLQDALIIPSRTGALDNDNLKSAIMTYGAVYTTMYAGINDSSDPDYDPFSNYYDDGTYTYYYSGARDFNHCVALVGWDDAKVVPAGGGAPGPGAWIVRNSWGTGFGQGGYFYISYYDTKVGYGTNAVFINAQAPDRSMVYSYDYLGWVSEWGYGDSTAWAANTFTAMEGGQLTEVGFYTNDVNTTYDVYIKQGGPTGTVLYSQLGGSFAYAGHHTLDLTSPVTLGGGDVFSVVVKFTTSGYTYPIPSERVWSGYSDNALVNAGESYISHDGNSWTDMSTLSAPSNACIKAFVEPAQEKKWTVAVYLAADNSLGGGTSSDPDFMDFDEMEKGLTTSGDDVNVVVLWDKPGTNDTVMYLVQPDGTEGSLATYTLDKNMWYIPAGWAFDYSNGWPKGAATPSEENMGDQSTLTNFLNWVFYNFQSDDYALILWNHGGGWEPKSKGTSTHVEYLLENGATWERTFSSSSSVEKKLDSGTRGGAQEPISQGVCWDDTSGDYLTTKEVAGGIADSSRDWVENLGFDACLMQMLEVAYEVRNVALYMTGSEESEWGNGWAYHQILAGITSTTTPLQLAQSWGNTRSRFVSGGLDTISSLDLSTIGDLAIAVSNLGDRLSTLLATNDRYQDIMYAKLLSLCFAYNEYLDLDDFCYWISVFIGDSTAQNLAQAVRTQIANTVVAIANGSGYASAGGISIYMPHYHDVHWMVSRGASHASYNSTNFAFCNDHTWDEFLNSWLATDYPDPFESNDSPAAGFNLGESYGTNITRLFAEADFDDSSTDWYKFTVPYDGNVDIYAWCTERNSDTVIYVYDSLAHANADSYFAMDDDGLKNVLGYNQLGSYLHLTDLLAGTCYLKVVPYNNTYGTDRDYEVWIATTLVATPAVFKVNPAGGVQADGPFYGAAFNSGSADVAEWVTISEPVEPGDVLELDPSNPGYYRKSRGKCSDLVAGVVSTDPGFVLGTNPSTVDSGFWADDSALMALVGIVPVKVTDEGGPIQPGDLLVCSSIPGYAMRWNQENGQTCALIGKALEPFDSGTGVIQVLLMR